MNALFPLVKKSLTKLTDLVYPVEPPPDDLRKQEEPFCQICGERFEGELTDEFTCSTCRGRVWAIRQARSAYVSVDYVRDVVHEFKYEEKFHRLPLLAEWLCEGFERYYADDPIPFDGLVPVPLYFWRKWHRGFNQAEELSKQLSRKTGIPVLNCLKRKRDTETQTHLRRNQRIRNQAGAYELKSNACVEHLKLLVIDDVFTTGGTSNACARVLKRAGAREVSVLTVARG